MSTKTNNPLGPSKSQGVILNQANIVGDCVNSTRWYVEGWGRLGLDQATSFVVVKRDIHAIYVGCRSTHDGYIIETVASGNNVTNPAPLTPSSIVVSVRAPFIGCLKAGTYYIRPLRPADPLNDGIADANSDYNMSVRGVGPNGAGTAGTIIEAVMIGHLEFVHNMDGYMLPTARPPLNVSFSLSSVQNSKSLWIHSAGRRRIEFSLRVAATNTQDFLIDAVHLANVGGVVDPHRKNLLTVTAGVGLNDQYEYDSMSDFYLMTCAGYVGNNFIAATLHDF